MAADSTACFQERLFAIGLGAYAAKFEEAEVDTLASLAFLVRAMPGQVSEDRFEKDVLIPILGEGAKPATEGKLRRLM